LGLRPGSIVGCDSDSTAIAAFARNFPYANTLTRPLEEVFSEPGVTAKPAKIAFKRTIARCDLLLGGPPCQGHSDLNNHTRRADPRNALMMVMLRAAEMLQPTHIIIENVRGILHDEGQIVEKVIRGLKRIGYSIDHGIVKLEQIGVPQLRHRFVLVGSREKSVNLDRMFARIESPRTVAWAWGAVRHDDSLMGTPSSMSKRNQERVNVLFKQDIYDLPDEHRPPCHRDGNHSYKSVYGRLRWDEPSQTITTGFGSMGQGRFVHPEQRRTLTPREAARLQFIPDFFDFGQVGRTQVARMIGNAVPPKLSYVLALALLR
jgi:DNA (cytosine-5)-methyltransferase 1